MPALATIGAITSLLSAAGGGVMSLIKNAEGRDIRKAQRKSEDEWYNIKRSQGYTQRADVQARVNEARNLLMEQNKRTSALNTVAGGSEEAVAAQKEAANKAVAQAESDMAAQSAAYNDNLENQHRARVAALEDQQAQSLQQEGAQIAQAAGQAVNAGVKLVGYDTYAGKTKDLPKDAIS